MMRALLLPLALLTIAGCAPKGAFPSLAPRPVEKLGMDEPLRVAAPVAEDPALIKRVAELLATARRGQRDFEASLPAARSGGAPMGSEAWVQAQQALSALEASRTPTLTALADLDALRAERASLPTSPADYQALLEAVEAVTILARTQQQQVDSLRESLG